MTKEVMQLWRKQTTILSFIN